MHPKGAIILLQGRKKGKISGAHTLRVSHTLNGVVITYYPQNAAYAMFSYRISTKQHGIASSTLDHKVKNLLNYIVGARTYDTRGYPREAGCLQAGTTVSANFHTTYLIAAGHIESDAPF